MILIISNKADLCVDFVVRTLRNRGEEFLRLNTEDLPGCAVSLHNPEFDFTHLDGCYIKELKSVWFRRPGRPFQDISPDLRPPLPVLQYIADQWNSLIDGIRSSPGALWINDPGKNRDAECKISQLRIAGRVGFKVPRTCITTVRDDAIKFLRECDGHVIAKALYSPLIEFPEKDYFIFTSAVSSFEDALEKELQLAPTIFQEHINPKVDYRVTVVGSHCFAAKIESVDGNEIPTDWRTRKEGLRFVPTEIPEEVSRKCKELVEKLGLVFGAIDLVQSKGEFFFLEINPNGEWGWLQGTFPVAEALCDYLVSGEKHDR